MNLWPSCRDVSRELSATRDHGDGLNWPTRFHLLICDVCRRVRLQFDVLGGVVKSATGFGPTLSVDAKERIRRALK